MAFVLAHPVSTVRCSAALRAGRRAATRLWARRNLTPQERANLYVGMTPPAVVTASLGGHLARDGRDRW